MSLDVDLMVTKPTSVYSNNITHNLGKMAGAVQVTDELTLYDILWRPEEHNLKFAKDIADLLHKGWAMLLADPMGYSEYNPENGWGSYEGLCRFVHDYRDACYEEPDAEIRVWR